MIAFGIMLWRSANNGEFLLRFSTGICQDPEIFVGPSIHSSVEVLWSSNFQLGLGLRKTTEYQMN